MVATSPEAQTFETMEAESAYRAETPLFDNRITIVGFRRALASIAWLWNTETHDSYFLFGTVDLVPDELPLLDCPTKKPYVPLGKKSHWRAYFANHEVASSAALQWYEGLVLRGDWGAPWLDPQIKKPMALDERLHEPSWPRTILLRSTTAVPFASQREAATRAHHTVSTAGAAMKAIEPDEKAILVEALRRECHLDLDTYPHLCQSAHIFAPLPILRHYSTRLDSDDETGDRGVLINLVPRVGEQLDKLTVEVLEKRPTGIRLLACARPSSAFLRVPLAEEVEQITIRVVHDDLGLLIDEGPYAFLRAIATNMQIIDRYRRVNVPERGKRPAQTHRIPIAGMAQMILTGSERGASAAAVLYGAEGKAAKNRGGEQLWFRDNAQAAQEQVRKLLAGAKKRVLVLDPYFSAPDVRPYLPWITGTDVSSEVLTSSKGLRETSHLGAIDENGKSNKTQRELLHLKDLAKELEDCLAMRQIYPTTVRVMTGQQPVHDRFLVIDDKAWLLGSSLNAFGTRGTMMIELSKTETVISELLQYCEPHASAGLTERIAHLEQSVQPASSADA